MKSDTIHTQLTNSVNSSAKSCPSCSAPETEKNELKTYNITTNPTKKYLPFVEVQSSVSSKPLKLLVDSGASISLIKIDAVEKMPEIVKHIISFSGIGSIDNPMHSFGHIIVNFDSLNNHFHVVPNIYFPYDGIIGNDFLSTNNCKIDYAEGLLLVDKIKLHLKFNEPIFTIPPRTETIIECSVLNPDVKEGLILDQNPIDSLLVANCIVKVKPNSRVNISVVNTSESTIRIDSNNLKFKISPFDISYSHEIFHVTHTGDNQNCLNRTEEVINLLRVSHLNSEETNALYDLCSDYSDIFHLPEDKLTYTDALQHEITTSSAVPINTKSYRFPEIHKQEVQSQINKMLNDGIIKPSTSPWSSPIWIVPKKVDASGQRKWRVVIDYRKLNDVTIGDSYPIPNISEILDQLGKCKYFSTLDLASGFHQIKISEQDAPKSAFSVPQGHFEFTRMPFGLKNAPATFQRLMNSALSGLQGIQCFVYLDDIVIYSYDLEVHMKNLSNVFDRLRKFRLKLQPDKCEFLRKEVSYLGHIITDKGVKPNPEKTKAVKEFPTPKCPKDIKSFLGLVSYYRRFIPDLAKLAKPLTSLLKKDTVFSWENEHQLAFESLKGKLISAPILAYPDFTQPFLLTCDASNYAISAILSQGPIGQDRPIAYASRTLNKAECNYSVTEKECLAIIFGTKTFRPYLYGHKFTIITDHRPLKWLFNCKDPGSKLVRWRLKLEEFDYDVIYKRGRINSNADTLSRYPVNPILQDDVDPQPSTSGLLDDCPIPETDTPIDILDDLIELGDLDISPLEEPNLDFIPLNPPSVSDPQSPLNPVPPLDPVPLLNPSTTSDQLPPLNSHSPPDFPAGSHSNSSKEYSEFLKSFSNKDETYNTYIKEHNESLLKSKTKTILVPLSVDYDESNPYLPEIISAADASIHDGERELHSFQKFTINDKTYYFLFTKVYYFDSCSYLDIFKTLKSVRDEIILKGDINEIAISDFRNPFEQNSFVKIYNMLAYLFNNTNITVNIHHNTIIYPVPTEIAKILKENHDIPIAGHLGSNRMYDRIKERYYWKNMRSEIEDYIKNCKLCQSNKALRKINKAPMQITTTSTRPFERISLDIVGPLPEAGQQKLKYILTLQDDLSKFSLAYPMSNATAEESCECLVHFITAFGIPKSILTDQGTNFTAELFKKTCDFLKIKQIWSSPYHPQTQGALERSHSTLKEYLKSYVNENQTNWHRFVYTAMLTYNSSVHTTTRFTPYELVFGHKPYIPDSIFDLRADVTYPEYIKMLHHRLKISREKALQNIQASKDKSKQYYDKHSRPVQYKVGEYAYLKNHVRLRKALSPLWKGPYKIVKVHSNNTLSLLINRRHVTHHFDEVKPANESD